MQPTLLSGAGAVHAARCWNNRANTGRQALENWREGFHLCRVATDHQAVTAFQPGNTAAGASVNMVDAHRLQFGGAPQVIVVMRVAAIDDGVAWLQQGCQLPQQFVDCCGRNHQPDHPRRLQAGDKVL